jgi:hypothetical protein
VVCAGPRLMHFPVLFLQGLESESSGGVNRSNSAAAGDPRGPENAAIQVVALPNGAHSQRLLSRQVLDECEPLPMFETGMALGP